MNEKQAFKMREEIQGILKKITSEYDLEDMFLLSSKEGMVAANRDLPSDFIIGLLYAVLGQMYNFILRKSDNKELYEEWINKNIEISTDAMRKFIFEEQNNE